MIPGYNHGNGGLIIPCGNKWELGCRAVYVHNMREDPAYMRQLDSSRSSKSCLHECDTVNFALSLLYLWSPSCHP